MAKPTFVAVVEPSSNWGSTADAATRTTSSFSVLAGDRLIVCAVSENNTNALDTPPVGGSLTWTADENIGVNDTDCDTRIWSATVDSDKSMTVAVTCSGGTGTRFWGFIVYQFRGSDGFGAAESTTGSGAPSLSITTTQANSAVIAINGDFNAVDGTTRTWRTVNSITPTSGNGLEKSYFRNSAAYGVYSAYWDDAGTAAAKTVGLSAPGSQRFGICAIEVKGSSAGGTQAITGALVTDADTFYGATVGRGAVDIGGALFANANSFFASTVSATYPITGALVTDADTFYGATIAAGAVNISGALFSDGDTFYGAAITTGAVDISGALFADADVFYASTVSQGGAPQDVTGALFSNANTFYGSTVAATYSVTGTLYSDADTFFGATVSATVGITGSLVADADTFFAATVTADGTPQDIIGALYANDNTFFGATVATDAVPSTETVRTPGGWLPTIYLDKHGRPVDLKTYKARTANQAIQAAAKAVKELPKEDRPEAREALRALREAVAADVSERVAEEARSLAAMVGELQGQLAKLEELARQEALDEEALIILLLVA